MITFLRSISATWVRLSAGILLGVAAFAAHAESDAFLQNQPPGDRPQQVQIGFNLVNITDVSEKEETLDFEGAVYLVWTDARLVYAPADFGMSDDWVAGDYSRAPGQMYQGKFAVNELFEGWRPRIVIPNGIGDRVMTNLAISVWPDGRVQYSETFYAKVETPMDLRRFPFDVQKLEIFFHPFIYQRDEILLVPDDTLARTWNQNMGIAEWDRKAVLMDERTVEIAYFDDSKESISEFVVTVEIGRSPMHVLVSIIFPMVLLVALTWCVFWMDDESLSNRVNISFIGILSVVAYYIVVFESLPKISYLTLIDGFIIATFLILAAGVVLTVAMETQARLGRKDFAYRVDRICRWAFPAAYLVMSVLMGVIFFSL